ncbi:hypothetical protein FDUTEX481_04238 [Tolypothrix sp. PCC 7601]|nr:hypothetical protein FDUTEX481_04238 [Tolypothrix sp. PCC 7601]
MHQIIFFLHPVPLPTWLNPIIELRGIPTPYTLYPTPSLT